MDFKKQLNEIKLLNKKIKKVKLLNKVIYQEKLDRELVLKVLSHDLSNPTSVAKMYTESILKSDNLQKIQQSAKKLELVINGLVAIIKNSQVLFIESDHEFSAKPTSLASIINYSLSIMSKKAKEKGVSFNTEINDKSDILAKLEIISLSIVNNILDNCIKFSAENSIINIKTSFNKKESIITIQDFGIGMPQDKIDSVLSSKKITSTLGTRNEKGTGQGLCIAIKSIRQYRGRLEISSQKGKGTLFKIFFPTFTLR